MRLKTRVNKERCRNKLWRTRWRPLTLQIETLEHQIRENRSIMPGMIISCSDSSRRRIKPVKPQVPLLSRQPYMPRCSMCKHQVVSSHGRIEQAIICLWSNSKALHTGSSRQLENRRGTSTNRRQSTKKSWSAPSQHSRINWRIIHKRKFV